MDTTTTTLSSRGTPEPGGATRCDDHSQPVVAASAGFHVWEASLVPLLGQPVKVLRKARKNLREGLDWRREGNQVRYSVAGVEALKSRFGVEATGETPPSVPVAASDAENPTSTAPAQKNAPAAPQGAAQWHPARVERVYANPRLCLVKLADGTLKTARLNPLWGKACLSARIEVRPEAPGREADFWIAKKPATWRA